MSKKILIATWGDPSKYERVTYVYNKHKIKSCTSTGALKKVLEPDNTIIIMLDSLISSFEFPNNFDNYNALSYYLAENLKHDYLSNPEFLKEFKGDRNAVFIAPNVGNFKAKNRDFIVTLKGETTDYFYVVYEKLAEFFIKWLTEYPLEIYFDMTHGINFMGNLTYRVLREILSILSLQGTVKFIVFNAEPYSPQLTEELYINVVEEEIIRPELFRKFPNSSKILPLKVNKKLLGDKEIKQISPQIQSCFHELQKDYKEYLTFLASVAQGIPLGIFTFFPGEMEDLLDYINKAINMYYKYIVLTFSGNEMVIKRQTYLTPYFRVLVQTYTLAHVLRRLNVSYQTEVSFPEINTLAKKIYKYFPVILERISYELDHIRKKELRKLGINKKRWRVFSKKKWWMVFCKGKKQKEDVTRRNFFAHGGIARNTVEFKLNDQGDICVRYREVMKEKIKEHLFEVAIEK